MNRYLRTNLLFLAMLLFPATAFACEEYKSHSTAELKEYRDKLAEAEADPLDRLFAFEELACSDRPTVRAYAIRVGLSAAKDDLVRQQIMFEAMMQKERLDIELAGEGSLSKEAKEFIRTRAGLWSERAEYRSRESGCISLNSNSACRRSQSIYLKGDKAELNYNDLVGSFELTSSGELVGFIRPGRNYPRIPAVIKLF
ncbi:MAG TPA: hypothetical protein VIN77_12085 [Aurantimonas sp.]